ncbi:MAG: hypothetical protein HOD60_12495 [Candidatus Nitrosopelagicus sp.]|nr:hypothetical protein [Candidatus Nitrosopelagicus sp.]
MKKFRDFESARKFVRKLGLKNKPEWQEYCKSGNKPDDIPSNPITIYKNKGWINSGDWFGTGNVANYKREYRYFTEAREFVRSLGLKNNNGWREYCASGNKPDDIPTSPDGTYKKDFKGYGDWLGTGVISSLEQSKKWLPFNEAKIEAQKIAKKLGIFTNAEWVKAHKDGKIPDFLPRYPRDIYKKDKKQ